MPDSLHSLSRSLADLQQVIRSCYLVSYKPASFQRDDRYRTIDIEAQKDGGKLTVFARKGYYTSASTQNLPDLLALRSGLYPRGDEFRWPVSSAFPGIRLECAKIPTP